jgi:hypothetical protein
MNLRKSILSIVLLFIAFPAICMEKEEKATKVRALQVIDNDTVIPLRSGVDDPTEVLLKRVRCSVTLERLLEDTGIELKEEGEKKTINPIAVPVASSKVLELIFNKMVPQMADNSLNLELLFEKEDISVVVDATIAVNYLDIKNGLLNKLIRYCAQVVNKDPEKNNIKDALLLLQPGPFRALVKELAALKVYPLVETEALNVCQGHTGSVLSVCAVETKNGWLIISGSKDNTVRICDMQGNLIAVCKGHTGCVNSVCAVKTKNGLRIISGSNDNTVCIWDTLSFMERFNCITPKQADEVYKLLTGNDTKETLYKKIKESFNKIGPRA